MRVSPSATRRRASGRQSASCRRDEGAIAARQNDEEADPQRDEAHRPPGRQRRRESDRSKGRTRWATPAVAATTSTRPIARARALRRPRPGPLVAPAPCRSAPRRPAIRPPHTPRPCTPASAPAASTNTMARADHTSTVSPAQIRPPTAFQRDGVERAHRASRRSRGPAPAAPARPASPSRDRSTPAERRRRATRAAPPPTTVTQTSSRVAAACCRRSAARLPAACSALARVKNRPGHGGRRSH